MANLLENLVLPSNIILVFLAGGVLLFIFRLKKAAAGLFAFSLSLYIFFAFGPTSYLLLGSLEYRYPPMQEPAEGAKKIVVLTGYAENDTRVPISSRVNSSSAFRILEAARLFKAGDFEEIIITGSDEVPMVMKELLVSIGVPEAGIVVENRSGSTFESAENVRAMVEASPFVLVTSAGHMPRSVMAFKRLGMDPLPAPTDYLSSENFLDASLLLSPFHLGCSDHAMHEYASMLYYRIFYGIKK